MKHYNFKTSKPIPLINILSEYLIQTNGKSVITEQLKCFLQQLTQNHSPIINLNESYHSSSFLMEAKQSSINYLSLLDLLMIKILPSDSSSPSFNFNWTDSITSNIITSNNLWFEYYSIMYNIGMIYYSFADDIFHQHQFQYMTENTSTKARKHLSSALYYFTKVKDEIGCKLTSTEKGNDLSFEGLTYMKNLCIMKSYICLMNTSYLKYKQYVSELKYNNNDIQKKMLFNLNQRLSITNEITLYADNALKYLTVIQSNVDKKVILYLQFLKSYYKSLIEYFQYDYYISLHSTIGNNLGFALTYLTNSVNIRKELKKHLESIEPIIASNIFQLNLDEDEKKLLHIIKENQIIHNPLTPPFTSIERTSLIIEPINPQDVPNYNDKDISKHSLSSIMSPELRKRMNNTENVLRTYLSTQLQHYSTDETINNQINNIKLPLRVSIHLKQYTLNDYILSKELLWKQIEFIQKWNCSKGIDNIFNKVNEHSQKLIGIFKVLKMNLNKEMENDLNYRKQYGDIKWNIPKSVSDTYVFHIDKRLNEFQTYCERNAEFEKKYNDDKNALNEICVPIDSIQSKVPGFIYDNTVTFTVDENNIIELYQKVTSLKNKHKEIIDKINIQQVKLEQLILIYTKIKQGDLDENEFIAKQKENIDLLIKNELDINENDLKQKINELIIICDKVNDISLESNNNINSLNQSYIEQYEKITKLYFYYLKQIIKIYNFIITKTNEMYEGINTIYNYLNERELAKRYLLTHCLNQNITEKTYVYNMCTPEQMEPMFHQLYKEMLAIGIDVSNLKSIFELGNNNT